MAYPWCVMLTPQPNGKKKAAILADAIWPPGSIIQIGFLDGDKSLQERIKAVAEEWLTRTGANLSFSWINDPKKAQIRISFRYDGSWSLLGRYCLEEKDTTAPTMNYGWLSPQSTDEEVREVVLHEFGHALGFIHEHQNPDGGIIWNEPKVIESLSKPPNSWDEATIRFNVLDHYDRRELIGTPFDPDSIMLYPFPADWTLNGVATKNNSDLSAADIALAKDVYR